ncbi:hypothetical protein [Streptomyces sp. PsTaAH-124]|uniref:hypothetical protein n=1 Tax=Streptomyces sp. PsTaAH-124 TaxID=1157638 RepID=UPI00035EADC5|nr:hypothetical protein [Streptomyces sp. PsTaAH-124]
MSSTEVCPRLTPPAVSELPGADVCQWLLAAADDTERAVREWLEQDIALLGCGEVFSAIRVSGTLVRAAARAEGEGAVTEYLRQTLADGPVFRDAESDMYYALVPAGTTWGSALRRVAGLECLDQACYLGVPAVHLMDPDRRLYWCVPITSAGVFCDPRTVWAVAQCGTALLDAESWAEGRSTADLEVIRAAARRALWESPPADPRELTVRVEALGRHVRQLGTRLAVLAPRIQGSRKEAAARVLRQISEVSGEPATEGDLARRLYDLGMVVGPALVLIVNPGPLTGAST